MSKTPQTFRSIIELWSTRKGMADDLAASGLNPGADAISKWWRRDSIPAEWWAAVLATDKAVQAGISAAMMTALAAREPAEART